MKNDTIKKIKQTLEFYLLGNSSDLYLITEITVISGKNKYHPTIRVDNNNSSISFPGNTVSGRLEDKTGALSEELGKYDSAEIVLANSIGKIVILISDKAIKIIKGTEAIAPKVEENHFEYGVSSTRDYYVKISQAADLLREIGILDDRNKVRNDKIRKYNQIDRFVEFADAAIKKIELKKTKVDIIDCACGKSYMSFILYFYITKILKLECKVTGLDITEAVINESISTAERLLYKNMDFKVADLKTYRHNGANPDLCISLHACDTATDYAIFTGITSKSKAIMCVPCCHSELSASQYDTGDLNGLLLNTPVFRNRFSDLMTDAIRVLVLKAFGYDVSVTEYISPLDSPKNLLITAVYTGKKSRESLNELKRILTGFSIKLTLPTLLEKEIGL